MGIEDAQTDSGVEIPESEQAEIAGRLEAFTANASEIKEAIAMAGNVEEILNGVNGALDSAPMVMGSMNEERMMSLSADGDPTAKMVSADSVLMALNELRQKEAEVLAVGDEKEYGYVDVNLDDYKDVIPGYILDRIGNLTRFSRPQ